jgi:transposase-like protein
MTKERIAALLGGELGSDSLKSDLVRLAIQQIVEEALEAKVRDVLGRGYYERREEGSTGYRNGYRRGKLKTSEGEVGYAVPQIRDTDSAELVAMREKLSGRTEALEALALEMYVRGCSTRDIEALFAAEDGKLLLSRTAVSEITDSLWQEYHGFAQRDLSEVRPLYLFLDGLYERLKPGGESEAILCAWAITWEGKKVLVALAPGTKESKECVIDFLRDLERRGLHEPVLTITDGAAGLVLAVKECSKKVLRQRCLAHKVRNILQKVATEAHAEVKQAALAAYQAPSPAMAQALRQDFKERFWKRYPSAVICFEEDFEACIAHLHCPPAHRRAIRTTNLLERLFQEDRRRMKPIAVFFGERPVLKLMYGTLLRAAETWRGLTITDLEREQLTRLWEQLDGGWKPTVVAAVAPGQPTAASRAATKKQS